jgi:spermidine synthase
MHQWFTEKQTPYLKISLEYSEKLFEQQTPYQHIEVYQTTGMGRLLVLDHCVMLTERDEFIYHEMNSHIPVSVHPAPTSVLVIGGGDGGCIRELVKHPSIQKIHLCELDEGVVACARRFFPSVASGYADSRVEIFIEDGFAFLSRMRGAYDIIIVDSTDPIGEAKKLFEQPFYQLCYEALAPDGILVFQSESPLHHLDLIKEIHHILLPLFEKVYLFTYPVPTYPGGEWSSTFASKKYHPIGDYERNALASSNLATRYYNTGMHVAAFYLPQYILEALPHASLSKG